jgi:thiamine pyrophosphokinase
MKSCVIISGGRLDVQFAFDFIKREQPDILITADKGLAFCEETGILPTQIVGDFDTLGTSLLPKYEAMGVPVKKYDPVKDYTDTEIAVRLGMELGADKITILGASEGNRLDHLFGNVLTMMAPAKAGVDCCMVDAHNRMRILTKPIEIRKEEQYGKYISLVPLTTDVHGVTLSGFKYPLWDYRFSVETTGSLGISNELVENIGKIDFRSGILLMLECMD